MRISSVILGALLATSLGCGGGDDGEDDNQSPVVTTSNQIGIEKSQITLSADASDPDGAISSYNWSQISGVPLDLTDTTSSSVTFTAPEVTAVETIQLRVTVTDNQGSTASATASVTVNPIMVEVTVQGKVYDTGIANANVVALAGSETFSAVSDAQGNYTIDISLDDSMVSHLIELTASGTGAYSTVNLASYLGSFEQLVIDAGQDGILTLNEQLGVNLTSVSTANAVLADEASGITIENQQSLDEAWLSLDGDLTLRYAAAVKLIAEYSASLPDLAIPDGYIDTYALLKEHEAVKSYLQQAKTKAPAEFDAAIEDILSNSNISFAGVNASVFDKVDTYYFHTDGQNTIGDGQLKINADNTAELLLNESEYQVNWSETEDGISLSYPAGDKLESSALQWDEDLQETVLVETLSSGQLLSWTYQGKHAAQMVVTNKLYQRFPNGEKPPQIIDDQSLFFTALRSNVALNAADVLALNGQYSFPVPPINENLINPTGGMKVENEAHRRLIAQLTFFGDFSTGGTVSVSKPKVYGDGSETTDTETMQWIIDNNGAINITGSSNYEIVFLSANEGKTPKVNVKRIDANGQYSVTANALLKEANWDQNTIAGIYDWAYVFDNINYWWVELNVDGTGLTVSANDFDKNGVLDDDEFVLMPGLWQLNENGQVVLRRYQANSSGELPRGFCTPIEFDPADSADCVLYHERVWDLHQVTEQDKYHFYHKHRYYEDAFRQNLTDPNEAGHILAVAYSDIRYWLKKEERPVELPESQSQAGRILFSQSPSSKSNSIQPKPFSPKNSVHSTKSMAKVEFEH